MGSIKTKITLRGRDAYDVEVETEDATVTVTLIGDGKSWWTEMLPDEARILAATLKTAADECDVEVQNRPRRLGATAEV